MLRYGWVVVSVALLIGVPCQAWAERYALLVGVSAYPAYEQSLQLRGPREDVILAKHVLLERGFSEAHITVLADGVPGSAGDPTRAIIAGSFERLARTIGPGDLIFVYFAGHGSQEPADRSIPEWQAAPDGLFRIFLPRDAGRWTEKKGAAIGVVDNAIADYQFRRWIDRLIDRGAFVWAVFDSCHSAALVRGGADPELRYRGIDPTELGVPSGALALAGKQAATSVARAGPPPAADNVSTATGRAGAAYFYAAQASELAPEYRMPEGDPDRRPHGLFGFTILKALERGTAFSYRQLAQQVLSDYRASTAFNVPVPLFSGNGLDAPVLGNTIATRVLQWPLESAPTLHVSAGLLHSIAVGSVFAVVPNALSKDSEALGYVVAQSVTLLSTNVAPVAHGGVTVALGQLPAGAFARLLQRSVDYTLRVAPPTGKMSASIQASIAHLEQAGVPGVKVRWSSAGEGADVRLIAHDGRLWFAGPSGGLVTAGSNRNISLGPESLVTADVLADYLHRIALTTNLTRIAAGLGAANPAEEFKIKATRRRGNASLAPVLREQVTTVQDRDQIELVLQNTGSTALDITGLYIDSRFGVNPVYPSGRPNRLLAGASEWVQFTVGATTTGLEQLVLIAVEVAPHAENESYDFSFLAQPALESTRSADTSADDIRSAFREAGFAQPASRGPSCALPAKTSVLMYLLKVRKAT